MKFEEAKKRIDKYFEELDPNELIESAREFGLSVRKVSSEEEAGLFQLNSLGSFSFTKSITFYQAEFSYEFSSTSSQRSYEKVRIIMGHKLKETLIA